MSESGSLARRLVSVEHDHWQVPEGTILAPIRRRASALIIDVIIVTGFLSIVSRWRIMDAWNFTLWASKDFHYSLAMVIALLGSHYLYWTWTGRHFSRSLGQRWLGLAVVSTDGGELSKRDWDSRAFRKLLYLLPILDIWFLLRDTMRIRQRHTHQSNIDLAAGSIVAIANSLPAHTRAFLR